MSSKGVQQDLRQHIQAQPVLSQGWMGRMRKQLGLQALLNRWQGARTSQASTDYEAWRHRFLLNRLGLCLWLALIILLTFIGRDLYNTLSPLKELQSIPEQQKTLWILIDAILTLLLLTCLVLHRTRFGRRYPAVLFLSLSWSITIAPQIVATLRGFPLPNILAWSLMFLIQATLIPVRWELHLISQLGSLLYFYGVNSALGLTLLPALPGQPERSIFMLTVLMYLLWFCFICDLAVYLYERLQRAEFESRCQAQLFLHAVSHDLRNPVTGTALVLKNLLKKEDPQITIPRSLLERMVESSDRQLKLINSLLEIHNSEVGGMVLSCRPTALRSVVEAVTSDLEPQLQENRVILDNQLTTKIPPVDVDETQIWRVFCNLIANALHHNPPGITLTIAATVEAGMVRCCVQDNGVGMAAADRDRVFDLYTRGSKTRRSLGLGLGLYLCRLIIQAHGGRIGVESYPGTGTTFWFTLPVAETGGEV